MTIGYLAWHFNGCLNLLSRGCARHLLKLFAARHLGEGGEELSATREYERYSCGHSKRIGTRLLLLLSSCC